MSELTEMEKYLQKLFTEAGQDLKKKFLKYTQDFQRLDAAKQQAVEDGNITEDEYKEWRKNKLLYGMHWQRLIDRNTSELLKYNQTAVKYINGEVPQIFASGYNKVAEQIPDSPVAGFDFELINADTVNNLIHEDGIILPPKKKVDPEKDKAWNAKLINAQLLQGIMQGESIPDMAKRMMTVANSDLAGATRTARTMHTAAQNAGRQSGYNRAAQQGIIFEKTWLAANNERTRLSHSLMNGQTVAHDEKFVSPMTGVKLMFPGDWNAEGGDVGSEIYNCRCTLITKFKGFKKLNGEEPEPHTRHEEPEKQEKTVAEKIAETVETIVRATTRAEAEEILYGESGIFELPAYGSTRAMCDELMIATANTINGLEQKFGIMKGFTEAARNFKPTFMEKTAGIASCVMGNGSTYFTAKFFKTTKYHLATVTQARDKGHFMPFDDEYALSYAFTHEYGHALEGYYVKHVLGRNMLEYDATYSEISDEIFDIARKIDPNNDPMIYMSNYAQKNDKELFAEIFANSQCGKPNVLGEAMNTWLEQKELIKWKT